jgi:uncharacterized membrane-anchored protein YhcB (DUF1043 family)
MFVKPQTPEDLQIQMNILKGNHVLLRKRFNNYFSCSGEMKNKTSQDYLDLYKSLQEVHTAMAEIGWQLYLYDLRPKKKKNFLK